MKDRRQTALCGKLRDPFLICNKQRACQYGKCTSARLGRLLERSRIQRTCGSSIDLTGLLVCATGVLDNQFIVL
jgi:hypothetical protein